MASPTEPDKIVSDLDERSHVEQKKSDRRRRAARTQSMTLIFIGEGTIHWTESILASEVATQTIGGMADDSVESIEESKRKRGNATDHEQESSPINEQKKVESKGASTNKKMKIKKRTVGHVDYTDIGNEVFLQMLSTAFSSLKYFKHISHGEDPLKFLPQYLNLVNQECYSELHLDQCEFFHRIGTTENIWNGRVSKHMAEKYSIRETYGASEDEVTGRLQQMKNQLEQTRNQVKQFEDDFLARCPADEDHLPQMMNELSSIVHLFVKDKQKHIRNDLHHHRQLLILYATDHLLLQMFFDLEPTDTQV